MARLIAAQVAWGVYWATCARGFPEFAAACAHNASMNAMHVLALESLEA